jgi:uncharacterized membrane protein
MDNSARIGLLYLAYILGLTVSSHPGWGWAIAIVFLGGMFVADQFLRQRRWQLSWPWQFALVVALIVAIFYGQLRVPLSNFLRCGELWIVIRVLLVAIGRSFGLRLVS